MLSLTCLSFFFFFNDTATTEIYTLSLHDALPILAGKTIGIDSQYIHVAGIKIPTAVLALLPITLPQGNYDEQRRARPPGEMRPDPMQGARPPRTGGVFPPDRPRPRGREEGGRGGPERAEGGYPQGERGYVH